MLKEAKVTYAQYVEQELYLEKFEDQQVKDLLSYYQKAKKSTIRDINTAARKKANHPARARLISLYNEIDRLITALTEKLTPKVAKAAGTAGAYSYKDTNRIVSWGNRVAGYNAVSRSAAQVTAMVSDEKLGGKFLDDWLWSALREDNGALKAEIAAAQIRGVGYKKLIGEMGEKYNTLLSSKKTKRNLETVTRSYIQASNAKAHSDIYKANKKVINGVEWSAIMENGNVETGRGTCPMCQALDGQRYDSESDGPNCPLHARCRCMYLPITKTWKELFGDDFDVDEMDEVYKKWYVRSPARKIVDRGLTKGDYADWWESRSEAFQNNAIGPKRADLVRSNIIDFEDITVFSEAYRKKLNKKSKKRYKMGDLVLLEDLPAENN